MRRKPVGKRGIVEVFPVTSSKQLSNKLTGSFYLSIGDLARKRWIEGGGEKRRVQCKKDEKRTG